MSSDPKTMDEKVREIREYVEKLGIGTEALDEVVHDIKSGEAADINNGGMDSQLKFILEANGGDMHKAKLSIS